MKNWRYLSGAAIWCVLLGLMLYSFISTSSPQRNNTTSAIASYFTEARHEVILQFPESRPVRTYDPIFVQIGFDEEGKPRFTQVGAVNRVVSADSKSNQVETTDWARAEFFSNAPAINSQYRLTMYETPLSMDFVLKTMLPRESREQIAKIVSRAYLDHHQEIFADLRPILEKGMQDAALVIQQELQTSIQKHTPELEKLGARYQTELIEEKVIPLINKEIWPIVQAEAKPMMEKVGEEIWSEASVWRFGWAFIYDATPLPRRDLARKEFNRFVENKALPILSLHIKDFIKLQQQILAEISRNEKVREVLKESFKTISSDTELQSVVVSILQDVFVDNERLKEVVNRHWTSPETEEAMRLADERLQPFVTEIGELLFGNPKKKVTPEFARVLRANVLKKDHRWFLLEEVESHPSVYVDPTIVKSLHVVLGKETDLNPFDYSIPGIKD